jgi:hypothetical protein
MLVSPATQREVEATMRTVPFQLLTQAAIEVGAGAAMAAVPTRNEAARTPKYLSEDIETSRDSGKTFRQGRMVYRKRGYCQGANGAHPGI